MVDRVAEIREAWALWKNDNISLNDDPRSAWQKLDLLIDAARAYADLLDSDALIIRRDENGEWPESAVYYVGRSDCDPRSRQYRPDRMRSGRSILDALASSQGVEP